MSPETDPILNELDIRLIRADADRLEVIGRIHSTSPYCIEPVEQSDGSLRFTVRMWIPALCLVAFGAVAPIVAIIEMWPIKASQLRTPSAYICSGLFLLFCLLALIMLTQWRSVVVRPGGQVTITEPRFLWHNYTELEAGKVWVDQVVRIDRDPPWFSYIRRARNQLKIEAMDGRIFGTPALVIHDGERAFVIAHDLPYNAHNLAERLIHDFGMHASGNKLIVQYSNFIG